MTTIDLQGFQVRDELEDIIIDLGGFEAVANSGYYGPKLPNDVRIVEKHLDEGRDDDYWDSPHEQGHEGVCFIVFEYRDRYFRKTGTADSYANRSWNGKFREVKKGEVQVVSYEWTEG